MIHKKDILIKDLASTLTIIKPYGKELITDDFKKLIENIFAFKVINENKAEEFYSLKVNVAIFTPNNNSQLESAKVKTVLDKTIFDIGDLVKLLERTNVKENTYKESLMIFKVFRFSYLTHEGKHSEKHHMGPFVINPPKDTYATMSTIVDADCKATTDFAGENFFYDLSCGPLKFSFKEILQAEFVNTAYVNEKAFKEENINYLYLAAKYMFNSINIRDLLSTCNATEFANFLAKYYFPRFIPTDYSLVVVDRMNYNEKSGVYYTSNFKPVANNTLLVSNIDMYNQLLNVDLPLFHNAKYETALTSALSILRTQRSNYNQQPTYRAEASEAGKVVNIDSLTDLAKKYNYITISPAIAPLLRGVIKSDIHITGSKVYNNGDLLMKCNFAGKNEDFYTRLGNYIVTIKGMAKDTTVEVLSHNEIENKVILQPKQSSIIELTEYKKLKTSLEAVFLQDATMFPKALLEMKAVITKLASLYSFTDLIKDEAVLGVLKLCDGQVALYNIRFRVMVLLLQEYYYEAIDSDEDVIKMLKTISIHPNTTSYITDLFRKLYSVYLDEYITHEASMLNTRKPLVTYHYDGAIAFKTLDSK